MQTLREKHDVSGKRVIVRAELNVPVAGGTIEDDFRLRKILPTLLFLKEHGARTIVLGHIDDTSDNSLRPVADYFAEQLPLTFVSDFIGSGGQQAVANMKKGEVVLFENIRSDAREQKNDPDFARQLAQYGDMYVNEAFSVSHRKHASIVGLPRHLPSYSGILFERERKHLSLALNPPRPFLFVLGGIKFETKLPLVGKFLDIADTVFVGGALANAFFKTKGYAMDASVTPEKPFALEQVVHHKHLMLPVDVGGAGFCKKPQEVQASESVLDTGPETLVQLRKHIEKAAFIVWNGPIGDYKKGFTTQNDALARALAESSAQTIIGGGDTVAAIRHLGLEDKFTFVSTAGGAMIQFLSDGTLPGIVALEASQKKFL